MHKKQREVSVTMHIFILSMSLKCVFSALYAGIMKKRINIQGKDKKGKMVRILSTTYYVIR